jgi:L-2-hydroxyglutarate oxidase LhgO
VALSNISLFIIRFNIWADRAVTNTDYLDAIVIGAGVVGLAVGRALARSGYETVIVERHRRIGEEASSRNSGVIHSGIYYPTNSLKARLCVAGRDRMYEYCLEKGVAHRRCGKLIVAGKTQAGLLENLRRKAVENGVDDLRWLDPAEVKALEPEVQCAAALLSPSTGILDVHELMNALLGDFEAAGGILVLDSSVQRLRPVADGLEAEIISDGEVSVVRARSVVNSAGLSAVDLAHRVEGSRLDELPVARYAKGNYFSCTGRPFSRLVYPLPNEAGLGIHATVDLAGNVTFGPDVEWVEAIDYSVDPGRGQDFYAAIREYWPTLPDRRLQPSYSGIRAKIVGPGEPAADFLFFGPERHGVAGLIHLFGMESPGLTAALAIGDYVRNLVGRASADAR